MRAPEVPALFPNVDPHWTPWGCDIDTSRVHTWWITRDGASAELPEEFDDCEFIAIIAASTARGEHYMDGTNGDHETIFYCRDARAWKLAYRLARMLARNDGWLALILRALPPTGGLFIEPGAEHRILQLDGEPMLALPAPRKEAA